MNRINSTEKELNEKIFDTLDNWMRENKIKNDAEHSKRISEKFPDVALN